MWNINKNNKAELLKTQFENWWVKEGSHSKLDIKELCFIAWDNGSYCEYYNEIEKRLKLKEK